MIFMFDQELEIMNGFMIKLRLAAFVLLLMPLTILAQEDHEIIPVNWKEVKEVAVNDPQRIKDLVTRLSATMIDTTMTWEERILAYFGQSYLTPKTELTEGRNLDKLLNEKKYEECLTGAKDLLKKNPVSIEGLFNAAFSISYMLKDSTNHHDVTLEEGQVYYNRMLRILNTIAVTGDGSEEKPFYVTAVSDEYTFLRYYLDIWNISKQFLVGTCDVFELGETSIYYNRKQIFFEITRVLEIENMLFE